MPDVTTRDEGDVLVLTLDDQVSVNDGQAEGYRQAVYQVILNRAPNPRIVVDLKPLEFLSSSGIAMLINIKKKVDSVKGKVVFCEIQPYVLDVLNVMKLGNFFVICGTVDEAVQRVRAA